LTASTKGTSLWENGLIWFGAALSIAEMQTGTYFAPLGFQQGLIAILLGHVIGCALLVTILGTAGAISLPLLDFTEFLYFIGSVFAPMIAIQLADYFITGRHYEQASFSRHNLFLWLVGFLLYRLLMQADLAIGSTLPAMLMTMTLCVAVNALRPQHKPIEAEVH
jgi:purine-cytosine permease-like protein